MQKAGPLGLALLLHVGILALLFSLSQAKPKKEIYVERIEFSLIAPQKKKALPSTILPVSVAKPKPQQRVQRQEEVRSKKTKKDELHAKNTLLDNAAKAPLSHIKEEKTFKNGQQQTKQTAKTLPTNSNIEKNDTSSIDKDLPRKNAPHTLLNEVMRDKSATRKADPLHLRSPKALYALSPSPDFTLSKDEREKSATQDKIRTLLIVKSDPNAPLTGKRVLKKTATGGYRWVNKKTGEAPKAPPAPKMAGLTRSSQGGITFKDQNRPHSNQARDDLIPTKDGGFSHTRSGWQAKIFPDGHVVFDENIASVSVSEKPPPLYEKLGIPTISTSFSFDATDAIMRLAGMDPYSEAKRSFLENTAQIRDALRSKWKSEKLGPAIAQLRTRLHNIWAKTPRSAQKRRSEILEVYANCNNEYAGIYARKIIISWVNTYLPINSNFAFPPNEITAFNAHYKEHPFLPYGDSSTEDFSHTNLQRSSRPLMQPPHPRARPVAP